MEEVLVMPAIMIKTFAVYNNIAQYRPTVKQHPPLNAIKMVVWHFVKTKVHGCGYFRHKRFKL